MKRSSIIYLSTIGLLLGVIAVMAYVFLIAGKTTVTAEDPRRAIELEPPERALVLSEMRGFLIAVHKITDAAVRNDANAIAAAAKPMGMAAAGGVSPALMTKLPLEFKQLGHSVHRDFDRIALDAEAMGDTRHALTQLGETLGKCVACHAAYQLIAPDTTQLMGIKAGGS
ncbi:MAG: hypothetical protein EPN55_07335 [Gammaproteobacteria bacterium]|nr:MAG: hypothetical protein EPN55_07335 [Gammaproteobacteria bacterium]